MSWVWGVVLSFGGCTVSNLGVNMQKLSHTRIAMSENPRQSVFKSPLWVAGMSMVILGSLADLASFGFADVSLLAPLGAMTLVINMLTAPCFLGETLSRRDIYLTLTIVFGTVLSIAFGSKENTTRTLDELEALYGTVSFITYCCLCVLFALAVAINLRKMHKRRRMGCPGPYDAQFLSFIYPCLAGCFGAFSVLFAKSGAEIIKATASGENEFDEFVTYVILAGLGCSVVMQMKYLNKGLSRADALYIVPVYQCCWVLMNTVLGMAYFQDYGRMSGIQITFFIIGITITCAAVYLLSMRTTGAAPTTTDPAQKTTPTTPLSRHRSLVYFNSSYDELEEENSMNSSPAGTELAVGVGVGALGALGVGGGDGVERQLELKLDVVSDAIDPTATAVITEANTAAHAAITVINNHTNTNTGTDADTDTDTNHTNHTDPNTSSNSSSSPRAGATVASPMTAKGGNSATNGLTVHVNGLAHGNASPRASSTAAAATSSPPLLTPTPTTTTATTDALTLSSQEPTSPSSTSVGNITNNSNPSFPAPRDLLTSLTSINTLSNGYQRFNQNAVREADVVPDIVAEEEAAKQQQQQQHKKKAKKGKKSKQAPTPPTTSTPANHAVEVDFLS